MISFFLNVSTFSMPGCLKLVWRLFIFYFSEVIVSRCLKFNIVLNYLFVFVCGSFNDAVSSSQYRPMNDRIVNEQ